MARCRGKGCSIDVGVRRERCPRCAAMKAERVRGVYRDRRESGHCVTQGCDDRPGPGHAYCFGCLSLKNPRTRDAKIRSRRKPDVVCERGGA